MANYINTETGAYPMTEAQIRDNFPNTSFPVPFVAPEPYAVVFESPRPTYYPIYQGVRESLPTLTVKGHWEQTWEVYELDAETVAANEAANAVRVQQDIVNATQQRLDDFARTRNYDGILSACTYASSSVPKFAAEGQYCVDSRDQTWATLYTLMGEVTAGTRPMPTGYADIEPLLPVLEWPQ